MCLSHEQLIYQGYPLVKIQHNFVFEHLTYFAFGYFWYFFLHHFQVFGSGNKTLQCIITFLYVASYMFCITCDLFVFL